MGGTRGRSRVLKRRSALVARSRAAAAAAGHDRQADDADEPDRQVALAKLENRAADQKCLTVTVRDEEGGPTGGYVNQDR